MSSVPAASPPRMGPRRGFSGAVWQPLAAAALVLLVGVLAWRFGAPLLFPSLGPTVLLQVEAPRLRASRLYNAAVGQLIGYASGLFGLALFAAWQEPSVLAGHALGLPRLGASVVAIAVALGAAVAARASHPPAAATVLLVTLGGLGTSLVTAPAFFSGLAIVLVLGELLRQARLRVVLPPSGEPQESNHPERLGPSAGD